MLYIIFIYQTYLISKHSYYYRHKHYYYYYYYNEVLVLCRLPWGFDYKNKIIKYNFLSV